MKFYLIIFICFISSVSVATTDKPVDLKVNLQLDGSDTADFHIITNSGEEVEMSALSEDSSGFSMLAEPTINDDGTISITVEVNAITKNSKVLMSKASFIVENRESATIEMTDSNFDGQTKSNIKIKVLCKY